MVTYSDLFQFVIMLCAVITLVILCTRKKQRPRSGKLRRYFVDPYLPADRLHLSFGSLVKYIIRQSIGLCQYPKRKPAPAPTGNRFAYPRRDTMQLPTTLIFYHLPGQPFNGNICFPRLLFLYPKTSCDVATHRRKDDADAQKEKISQTPKWLWHNQTPQRLQAQPSLGPSANDGIL